MSFERGAQPCQLQQMPGLYHTADDMIGVSPRLCRASAQTGALWKAGQGRLENEGGID